MQLDTSLPPRYGPARQAAVDFGTHDSETYRLLGDSYAFGADAQMPDAAKARANQYEHAINLNPRQLSYYERLAEALTTIDKPREEDAQFLTIGLKLFPGADWVRVGSAAVDFRLGHHDAAMTTLGAPESARESARFFGEGAAWRRHRPQDRGALGRDLRALPFFEQSLC